MNINRRTIYIAIPAILVILAVALFSLRGDKPNDEADGKPTKVTFKFQRPDRNRQGRTTIVTDRRFQRRLNNFVRQLSKTSAMDKQELDRLLGLLKSGREEDVLTAMIDAQSLKSEALVDFVKATLESPDKDVREEGVSMLAGVTNPAILPAVKIAAKDADPEIRIAALEALNYIGVTYNGGGGSSGPAKAEEASASNDTNASDTEKTNDANETNDTNETNDVQTDDNGDASNTSDNEETAEAGDEESSFELEEDDGEVDPTDFSTLTANDISTILSILSDAFEDSNIEVRSAALQAILQLDIDIQTQAFEIAQHSTYTDVRGTVLFMTATSANSDTLAIAFNALDDSDEAVRTSAADNIRLFIDKEFGSSAEAFSWWNANSDRYDDTLFLYNPEEAEDPQIEEAEDTKPEEAEDTKVDQ